MTRLTLKLGPFCVYGYFESARTRTADGSGCLEVLEVVLLMVDVVLDEEAKRYRRVVANNATCFKALFGNAIDCGHENFVLGQPPAQESFPGFAGISVRCYPGVLFVAGAGITAVDCGADEALAVVCG